MVRGTSASKLIRLRPSSVFFMELMASPPPSQVFSILMPFEKFVQVQGILGVSIDDVFRWSWTNSKVEWQLHWLGDRPQGWVKYMILVTSWCGFIYLKNNISKITPIIGCFMESIFLRITYFFTWVGVVQPATSSFLSFRGPLYNWDNNWPSLPNLLMVQKSQGQPPVGCIIKP